MSDWFSKDGCPPTPDGVGKNSVPESSGDERGIVPLGTPGNTGSPALSVPAGVFFCFLGGAVSSSSLSAIAPALVAYGFVAVSAKGDVRGRVLAVLAALVPAIGLGLQAGVASVLAAVLACLVALAVSQILLLGKMTPGVTCVTVAAITVCHLAVDEALALASGTTLSETILSLVDLYQEQLGSVSASVSAQLQSVRSMLAVIWPTVYVIVGLIEYLSARVGAWLVSSRVEEGRLRLPRLADYDLPLWVVAVFIVAMAGLAVGLTLSGTVADVILMASVNVALAVRFALAAQGLAVLAWLGQQKSVRGFAAGLIGLAALYLEVQFFIMTVVGLADVWLNFRRLQRGTGGPDAAGNAEQDQKSAQAD